MHDNAKRKNGAVLTALIRSNKIALSANRKAYISYLILSLVMTANSFLSLATTQYTINCAYRLFKKSIDYQSVVMGISLFAIAAIIFMGIGLLQRTMENRLMLDVTYYFEKSLNHKLGTIKWDFYESHETCLKIHEVRSNTLETIKKMINNTVFFLTCIPLAAIFGYYLLQINIFAAIAYIVLIFLFNRAAGKRFVKISGLWEELQPYTQKQSYFFGMSGDKITHQEFKFHRLFEFVSSKWEALFQEEYKIRLKIFRKYEFLLQTARILMNLPYIAMLLAVTYEIAMGRLEIGFLFMANQLFNNIIDTTASIQDKIANSKIESRYIKTYDEICGLADIAETNALLLSCDIHMKNITYTYPQSDVKALNHLNFSIKHGEKIAVVGVNGSGKTTCTNLLLSLTDHFKGSISGNGRTIDLSNSVSCILQDFAQYQMTVRENIEAGAPDRSFTEEELMSILDKVGLKDTILSFEKGIYTSLGQLEQGIELSKGQWQRLAIARLLAKDDASVWILDEPTAYLDPLSEIEIYHMIYRLAGSRTVLFISHRLGFAKRADRIVLFEGGQITEQGTHEELIRQNGVYAKMYRSQESWYAA